MKKKKVVSFLFIVYLLHPIIIENTAFYSIQGSLVIDKNQGSSNIIIIEGIYFFVIDNTGLVSDNFKRN